MACTLSLLICTLYTLASAQVVPDLPPLPTASLPVSPSPLPSALFDIVHPSPSPVSPTGVPPKASAVPSVPVEGENQSQGLPTPAPSTTLAANPSKPPLGSSITSKPTVSASASPSPFWEFTNADGKCERDTSHPRPRLGKSQLRYAVCVLLSAAAVGLASLLYGLAADWEAKEDHSWLRLFSIITSRLLILCAVKISAALVASITKASPEDGALDASGAFLTWGSAIFTRLYYEGFKMNLTILEFVDGDTVWHHELREYLSARPVISEDEDELLNKTEVEPNGSVADRNKRTADRLTIRQRLLGGNFERKLQMFTSVLYIASESSVLTVNVIGLVDALRSNPANAVYFSSDDSAGQCGLSSSDLPSKLLPRSHLVALPRY